jgi:hypothetical protein
MGKVIAPGQKPGDLKAGPQAAARQQAAACARATQAEAEGQVGP